jgi:hypothetical protein
MMPDTSPGDSIIFVLTSSVGLALRMATAAALLSQDRGAWLLIEPSLSWNWTLRDALGVHTLGHAATLETFVAIWVRPLLDWRDN